MYCELSPHGANGCVAGFGVQSGADFTRTPALALVAPIVMVSAAREPAMKKFRNPLRMP